MAATSSKTGKHRGLPGNLQAGVLLALLTPLCVAHAEDGRTPMSEAADPHRSSAGFFDIHVCHWPDRPLFFMALLSTERHEEIKSVEIRTPDGVPLGSLDLNKFRVIKAKDKPEKRAFISQFDVANRAPNGWYEAEITLKDGSRYSARDYVIISAMDLASGIEPADASENEDIPRALSWNPVVGARYYQVFIRDEWSGEMLYQSELLDKPELTLPDGLLQRGGDYSWRIHARDLNENILLGDFNHGSLSKRSSFSIAEAVLARTTR